MVSRMEGRVLFKIFLIYVSIVRYTQHVDFKDQDTKTSCTDIFDGFVAYFPKDTGRRPKGSSYFLNPRPVPGVLLVDICPRSTEEGVMNLQLDLSPAIKAN